MPLPALDAPPSVRAAAIAAPPSGLNATAFLLQHHVTPFRALSLAGGAVAASASASVSFDGRAAHATLPPVDEFVGAEEMTIEAWVAVRGHTDGVLLALRDASDSTAKVEVHAARWDTSAETRALELRFSAPSVEGGIAALRHSAPFPAGTHLLSVVLGAEGILLYIDGELALKSSLPLVPFTSAPTVELFGAAAAATPCVQGELHALALYNATLPASEILAAADAARPLLPAVTGDWFLDNETLTTTYVVRDAAQCSYDWYDPCIHELGTYKAEPCPDSDPGCQMASRDDSGLGGDRMFWSDPATWNGTMPGLDENVTIHPGMRVVLDVSPPRLYGLNIFGSLEILSNGSDIALSALWVVVREGGNLTAGTPSSPFNGSLDLALSGDRYTRGPRFNRVDHGAKLLLVFGALRLHGRVPSPTWTVLNSTAVAGSREVVVSGAVDWREGDELVLPSTDYEPSHTETATLLSARTVVGADGSPAALLTLSAPLAHTHFGEVETHGGRAVSMRGEVGHLTRDIVIRGMDNDEDPRFRSLWNGGTRARGSTLSACVRIPSCHRP